MDRTNSCTPLTPEIVEMELGSESASGSDGACVNDSKNNSNIKTHSSTFSSHANHKHRKAHSKKVLEGKSVAEE